MQTYRCVYEMEVNDVSGGVDVRSVDYMDEGKRGVQSESEIEGMPTTLRVTKATKHMIDVFKVIPSESYDSVLKRAFEHLVEEHFELTDETKSMLVERMKKLQEGKVLSLSNVLQRMRQSKRRGKRLNGQI